MHCTVISFIVGNAFLSSPINSFPLLPIKKNTFVSSFPSAPTEMFAVESLSSSTLERTSTSIVRHATVEDVPAIYDLLQSLEGRLKKRSIFDVFSMVRRNFSVVRMLQDGDNHRAIGYLEFQQFEDEEEIIGFLDKEYNYEFDYQEGDILVDIGGFASSFDQSAIDQGPFSLNFIKWYQKSNIKDHLLEHNKTHGRVIFVWITLKENSSVDTCMEMLIRSTFKKHSGRPRVKEGPRSTMVGKDGSKQEWFLKMIYCNSLMSKSKLELEAVR